MTESVEVKNKPQKSGAPASFGGGTYLKRLLAVLPASVCLSFTVFLFGPCELAASDPDSLTFSVGDVLVWMGLFSLLFCAAVTLILPLFKGKKLCIAASVVFSAAVSAYIEGTCISGFLGILGGDGVAWEEMLPVMLLDLLLWIAVAALVFFLMYRFSKIWKSCLRFVSILLIIMQLAGLVSILLTSSGGDETKYYLNKDEIYDFSSEKNIVVFVLDRLDYDYVEQLKADSPDFFDKLDGFTCYSNAMSVYARTNPAASFILAGDEEDAYKIPRAEYYDKQWEGENLLSKLADNGYRVNLYGHTAGLIGTGKNVVGDVTNMSDMQGKINGLRLINNMGRLTMYRYSPFTFKPFFWCWTEQINAGVYPSIEVNQSAFNTVDYELSVSSEYKYFKFYHFIGSHPPYTLNEDGTVSDSATNLLTQTKGCFNIVYNILDEMKEKDIYKDSAIFILADHGWAVDDTADLQKATTIGMFYKPSGEEGTPMTYSKAPVSHRNIPATILKEAGIATDGAALDEVAEDSDIIRYYYKTVVSGDHETSVSVWSVQGDANLFTNWTKVSEYAADGYFY